LLTNEFTPAVHTYAQVAVTVALGEIIMISVTVTMMGGGHVKVVDDVGEDVVNDDVSDDVSEDDSSGCDSVLPVWGQVLRIIYHNIQQNDYYHHERGLQADRSMLLSMNRCHCRSSRSLSPGDVD